MPRQVAAAADTHDDSKTADSDETQAGLRETNGREGRGVLDVLVETYTVFYTIGGRGSRGNIIHVRVIERLDVHREIKVRITSWLWSTRNDREDVRKTSSFIVRLEAHLGQLDGHWGLLWSGLRISAGAPWCAVGGTVSCSKHLFHFLKISGLHYSFVRDGW